MISQYQTDNLQECQYGHIVSHHLLLVIPLYEKGAGRLEDAF
jgi:hypothetical protein